MSGKPVIHVVDDDDGVRTALMRLLGAAGFEARGYASTGEFLLKPPDEAPGCLVLDVRMPGPSGLELQAALRSRGVTLPVIFLTGYADVASSVKAMKAGAVDFLTKPVEGNVLLEAIRRGLANDAMQREARGDAEVLRARFASLTPREGQVFACIVSGKLNKQIAKELGIGERTVKAHRAQVMEKLEAGSAVELGRFAERLRQLPGA